MRKIRERANARQGAVDDNRGQRENCRNYLGRIGPPRRDATQRNATSRFHFIDQPLLQSERTFYEHNVVCACPKGWILDPSLDKSIDPLFFLLTYRCPRCYLKPAHFKQLPSPVAGDSTCFEYRSLPIVLTVEFQCAWPFAVMFAQLE